MGTWKAREKSLIPRVKSIVDKSLILGVKVKAIFILPTVISMWEILRMDKSRALGSFTKMEI
jgi:hypothetical protein